MNKRWEKVIDTNHGDQYVQTVEYHVGDTIQIVGRAVHVYRVFE